MSDTAITILREMNGAEFVIVFAVIVIAIMYLVPKIKYVKELMTSWYDRKKRQEEVFESILQNKKDIEQLQKNDIEYRNALQSLETNISKSINELKTMVEDNSTKNEDRYIQQVRSEILNFCNTCSVRDYRQDAYKHIMDLHQEYIEILNNRGQENGQITESYSIMLEIYRDKIRDGQFVE